MTSVANVTTSDYRKAVGRIVRDLQAQHSLSDIDFSEKIGCSVGTVRKTRNEESELGAIFLARIEAVFGHGAIDPYLNLVGARSVPLVSDPALDAMPPMTAAIHQLAVARSPSSPGGEAITHSELLGMEPEIDAAIRALTALKMRASELRAA